jgi:lysozyme
MVLPSVIRKAWDSFKKWCKKYEAVVSVLFSVIPVIGQFVAKTIVKRIAAGLLGLSAMGLVGIAQQEDFRGKAYLDDAGVPTVGFGSTKGVKMGDTITVRQALSRLAGEVNDEYEDGLHKLAEDIPMFQHEYDVYLRVTYNIGVHAFSTSTMLRKLREGDYAGACAGIKLFNKVTVNGQKVFNQGLANLREEQYRECMRDPNE